MKIEEAIPKIMAEMSAVGKGRVNEMQGYAYRGIDDVYNALQKVMAKYGVFTIPEVLEVSTQERVSSKGTVMFYSTVKTKYRFVADDGSGFEAIVVGRGMDNSDKDLNKAMAVAHKYALLQVFCIPTEEPKDPEVDHAEVLPAVEEKQEKWEEEAVEPAGLKEDIKKLESAKTIQELKMEYIKIYQKYATTPYAEQIMAVKNRIKQKLGG